MDIPELVIPGVLSFDWLPVDQFRAKPGEHGPFCTRRLQVRHKGGAFNLLLFADVPIQLMTEDERTADEQHARNCDEVMANDLPQCPDF